MSAPRHLYRLAVGGTATALLVSGLASSASAATYPSITIAQAKAALPAAAKLPGAVKLVGKIGTTKTAYAIPCATSPKPVTLPGATATGAIYANPATSDSSPANLIWHVSAIVYATPTAAAAGAAKVIAADKACKKSSSASSPTGSETVTRTVSEKYADGTWHGYRTVDHLTESNGKETLNIRDYVTFVVRGNVLLSIEEAAPALANNGALQDSRRKAVTTLVLTKFAAIK